MTELPPIGLGTFENTDREACIESVRLALELGYRHVDTAQVYGTEPFVREGIRQANVDRDEVFLATKVHDQNSGLGYDRFYEAAQNRRDELGVDTVDLLYVHWPIGQYDPEETLPLLDAAVNDGIATHVGVSNFTPDLLDEASDVLDAPIFAHQAELHPFLQRDDLVAYAQEHDHYLVAYSPLARGDVFENDVLTDIAEKHDTSAAQVSLAWLCSKENVVVIPKATGEAHLRDNLAARNLDLDAEDVERIEAIERTERYFDKPDAPWN